MHSSRARIPALLLASLALAACDKPAEDPAQAPAPAPGHSDTPAIAPPAADGRNPKSATPLQPAADPNLLARLPTQTTRLQVRNEVAEELGSLLVWCTPDAPLDDAASRDQAAVVLSHLGVLSDASDDIVIWGAVPANGRINTDSPRGLALDPAALAGCYLSCFILSNPISLERQGDAIILSIPAKFRSGLPASDYPHPLWHPGDEWSSYVRTKSLDFALVDDRLVAVMRREGPAPTEALPPREWDGLWRWIEGAYVRPRTAHFAYILSADNPHTVSLERAYADLLPVFNAQNCLACHAPDNRENARQLFVFELPAQALAIRAPLAAVMIEESDGPPESTGCTVASLRTLPNAQSITDAAMRFLEEGDGATEYEWIRLIRPGEEDVPRIAP